ncbi:MAG: DNA repair exonuclease [Aerococcus sp.]|nr:DNA repair exonuclease [Aerococcus sp.]
MIRFIHAADLHLGRPMHQLQVFDKQLQQTLKNSLANSFNRLIDTAINEQVDCVLFSGDIYDSPTGALAEQFRFKGGMERLAAANIPAYVLFGNHDYQNIHAHHIDLPDNVTVFPEDVKTVTLKTASNETVALSGFSYGTQWIKTNPLDQYPNKRMSADYHIGLLHGAEKTGNPADDRYAPFDAKQMQSLGYDYWALGHIHRHHAVHDDPRIWYPGNIQGMRANEAGPKGGLFVTLQPGQMPQVEPFETTDWQFYVKSVNLKDVASVEDLRVVIEHALNDVHHEAQREALNLLTVLEGHVTSDNEEALHWYEEYSEPLLNEERRSMQRKFANQGEAFGQVALYTMKLVIDAPEMAVTYRSFDQQAVLQRIDQYQDEATFEELIEPLLRNSQWLTQVWPMIDQEQFKEEVLATAKQQLFFMNQTLNDD